MNFHPCNFTDRYIPGVSNFAIAGEGYRESSPLIESKLIPVIYGPYVKRDMMAAYRTHKSSEYRHNAAYEIYRS